MHNIPQTLTWIGDEGGHLELLDQTRLPLEIVTHVCRDVPSVFEAIQTLRVRGAPAIGIAAAYGLCLAAQCGESAPADEIRQAVLEAADYLATSRPTAVNLFYALDHLRQILSELGTLASPAEICRGLLQAAQAYHDQDRQMCRAIGQHGAALLSDGLGVLTHCNAGSLATSEYGTALAVIYAAHEAGKKLHVYVDETRPLLQGSRLTAWELMQAGVQTTLICDSMAAQVMQSGKVQAVIVGADRITANGDVANKIGTYGVAVLAAAHQIPFYVAAPSSTFDLTLRSGEEIPIEQRKPEEITEGFSRRTAPPGVQVYNPAFDVTPARLIKAIITEHGVISPVTDAEILRVLNTAQ